MQTILPKATYLISQPWPVFFLAGPVNGGDDWHQQCCNELEKHLKDFYVAIPCNYFEGHPLKQVQAPKIGTDFDRQLPWERLYLNIASVKGCIIFWLPCESRTNPRRDGLPYAMDTRGELGEWRGRLMHEPEIKMVIGAEMNFPGLSVIQRNFCMATETDFPLYPSLKTTVEAAVQKAREK